MKVYLLRYYDWNDDVREMPEQILASGRVLTTLDSAKAAAHQYNQEIVNDHNEGIEDPDEMMSDAAQLVWEADEDGALVAEDHDFEITFAIHALKLEGPQGVDLLTLLQDCRAAVRTVVSSGGDFMYRSEDGDDLDADALVARLDEAVLELEGQS